MQSKEEEKEARRKGEQMYFHDNVTISNCKYIEILFA